MKPKSIASLPGAGHRRVGELRNLLNSLGTTSLGSFATGSAFDGGLESVGLERFREEEVSALRKLEEGKFDQITDAEAVELEAIVQREVFPVSFIVNRSFEALPVPWQHFNSGAIRSAIEAAIPAVGRIDYLADDGKHAEHLGTGFIVGDGLMMTSRSVAEFFVNGAGLGPLTFKPDRPPGVFDLGRERGVPPTDLSHIMRITGIRMVHPYWDMALMELDHMPIGVSPLRLSVLAPEDLQDRQIAKIGYPAVLGRFDRLQQKGAELEIFVLGGVGGVKRLAPGMAKGRLPISSYGRNVSALHYQTSAVASAGTGGAPILDVLSGQVIGIGFASTGFSGSYAVPSHDLACDHRVVDAGVSFAGSIPARASRWASFWKPPKKLKGTTKGGTNPQPTADQEPLPATNLPQPYPSGSIAERLAQLRLAKKNAAPGDGADSLQRFRQSAAVLVAFAPEKLQPIGSGPVPDRIAAMESLQIDLIRNPYDEDGNLDESLWSLDTGPRIQALRELQTVEKMRQAQAANYDLLPSLPLQKFLSQAIAMSPPFDPDQMDVAELTALATVSGWLQDTEPGNALPNPVDLLQLIERRRDRALLNRLTSDTFTGREEERALIQAHLSSEEPRVLFVSGVGGMGKSALISRALLDWEGLEPGQDTVPKGGRIWVRVDMDHSLIAPDRPRSVLDQAAHQMIRSYPELQSLLQRYSQESYQRRRSVDQSRLESSDADSDDSDADRFAEILGSTLSQPGKRVAFWLDTFEEAQFLGTVVAERLLRLATRLTKAQPRLRLIISGRIPPPAVEKLKQEQERSASTSTAGTTLAIQALQVFTLPKPPLQALVLRALPQSSATALLAKLLNRQSLLQGVNPPGRELVDAAVEILGGNPLTLRLAAPVLQAQGKAGLKNLDKLGEDVRKKQLVSRIVAHLHDKDLDKLLLPGLEVRIITPDVVRDVLAQPCKLGRLSEAQAWTLFDKLRREITLVEPEREGAPGGREALRYRQDIRLIIVGDQQGKLTSKAFQIHENAVGLWERQKGPLARAEELYHRLRLGQPAAKLNQRWDAEAGRLLRSTMDELPIRSPQYIWLANKLTVGLETVRTARVGQADWEQQTATEVQRLLLGNQPEQALTLLGKRSKRLAGSPLYGLESRAHLFAGQELQAAAVAKKGMEACRKVSKQTAVDLALLAAFIHERLGHFPTAEKMATEALGLAQAANDDNLILSSLLRARRLRRLAWERKGRKERLPPPSPSIEEVALAMGDHNLRKNPSVLRELAAELGASHPNFLTLAADVLLEELLRAQSNADLTNWLNRQDMLTAEELRIFLAAGRQHEIISLARSRIDERLHLPFKPNLVPFYEALRDLFREDVNAALHRQYQTRKPEPVAAQAAAKASHPKQKEAVRRKTKRSASQAAASHPAKSAPSQTSIVSKSFVSKWRKPLVDVLSRLKTSSRGTITRFVLEFDDSVLTRGRVQGVAVATDMFDHALKLQRLPELLRSLKSSLTGDDLRIVEKALDELASAEAEPVEPGLSDE